MRAILNNRLSLWLLLAVPAIAMLVRWSQGSQDIVDAIAATGEYAAQLMIFAMMLGPLAAIIGQPDWLRWLVARRRYFGVAAFLYALLHLIFYVIDMQDLTSMLDELGAPGIWTAWVAFALMLPAAITSSDAAMRGLRAVWKRVQRLVYPAAVLTLLHWGFVHNGWWEALLNFAPLILLVALRAVGFRVHRQQGV